MESKNNKIIDIDKLIKDNNHKVSKNLQRWQKLQELIKEEITLNEKIKSQRKIDVKHLRENFSTYFKNKLKIKETYDLYNHSINKNIEKINEIKLCENRDELGDCDLAVNNLLKLLRNNYKNLFSLLSNLEDEDKDEIAELIGHFFYENILILDPEHEELLNLCYLLLEKEINELESPNINDFLETSFIGRMFKYLCKRSDVKNYLSLTVKDLILKLENLSENFMEIDIDKINHYIKNSINDEFLFSNYFMEKTKNIFEKNKKVPSALGEFDLIDGSGIKRKKTTLVGESGLNSTVQPNTARQSIKSYSFVENSNSGFNGNTDNSEYFVSEPSVEEFEPRKSLIDQEIRNNKNLVDLTDEDIIKKYQDETDEELKEYYLCVLNKFISDTKDKYTNKKLLDLIKSFGSESSKVLFIFKKNYEQIRYFMDEFLHSLIENSSLIPYIIKCICKMIFILITKKFPTLSILERNSFIGKFIFGKIIMPIICNPDYNGIIYSHIISTNTRNNLKNINLILFKISRFNLFDSQRNSNFTVFNNYLIEIIPLISNLYKSLIKVKLPDKIEGFLRSLDNKDNLSADLENNDKEYFKTFQDQIYYFQSICISANHLHILVKTIKKSKETLGDTHPLFQASKSLFEKLSFFKKTSEKANKYFLYIYKIKNPKKINEIFIKEQKLTFSQNENDNMQHNFILSRIKYCIKIIFKSLNLINPRVHSFLESADTTEKLILGLNKIIELEDFNESENRIPLTWYSFYLNNYISKLDENYIKNEFDLFYSELLDEVLAYIEKLKNINNVLNSKLGMNLRCAEKINEYVYKDYLKLKSIENFIRIDKFMETSLVQVCIRKTTKEEKLNNSEFPALQVTKLEGCYHQKLHSVSRLLDGKPEKKPLIKKIFSNVMNNFSNTLFNNNSGSGYNNNPHHELNNSNIKSLVNSNNSYGNYNINNGNGVNSGGENALNSSVMQGGPSRISAYSIDGHCDSIIEFIRVFQNYNEIKEDIFFGETRNNVAKTIEDYMHIVFESIDKDRIFAGYDQERKKIVLDDIENYLFRKMYKRNFPDKPLEDDNSFYERCRMFAWVTPEHLLIKEKMKNEIIWEQGILILQNIDNEKSPVDKLNCIRSVEYLILNSINFCLCESDKIAGADDLYPIFAYLVLKSQPKRFISNINYINTFLYGEKKTNVYGQLFFKMIFARTLIEKLKRDFFTSMTDEEYNEKMKVFELTRARSNSRVIRKGGVRKENNF